MNSKAAKTPAKPYWEMNTRELEEATREFDKEDLSSGRPLRGKMLERYLKARSKRPAGRNSQTMKGRQVANTGRSTASKTVAVSVDGTLLRRADRLARRLKT